MGGEDRRKDKAVKSRKVKNSLSVYYTNCRSILNKIDLLRGMACVEDFDIIALTETWLDMSGKVFNTEVQIDGYTLFHKDRDHRKGGGVALYVRDTLQCCLNDKIKTDGKTETLWVDIKDGSQTVVMGVVYRPPNTTNDSNTALWQEIDKAGRYSQVCVVGDFNFRNIDWGLMTGNSEAEDFLTVIQDNFLKQVVLEPTRGNNILDLILTNREDSITQVEIGGQLGNNDHREIRYKLKWEDTYSSKNTVKIPDFRRANFEGLRLYLQGVDWWEGQVVREGEGEAGEGERVWVKPR